MSRRCARPMCAEQASTTLSYAYDDRIVWLESLRPDPHPATHDLCEKHASRQSVPKGWELRDQRSGSGPTYLRRAV